MSAVYSRDPPEHGTTAMTGEALKDRINAMLQDGVFILRNKMFRYVEGGALGSEVLDALLPPDGPLEFETELWDYKRSLPTSASRNSGDSDDYKRHMAELVKDVVAFHNS